MLGKEILNQLSAYKQGMQIKDVQKKFNLDRIVKLASNENPYGYSPEISNVLKDLETDFEIYPDGYALELRQSLAEKLSVDEEQLVFGAGSDEVITFICRAFLYEGTNTIMATPTFPQYRHHALIEGATLKEVPTLGNGKHDLEQMLNAIDEHTKIVWLCSPDNPTGNLISRDEFSSFMEKCPKNVLVVLDEAYYEYIDASLQLSLHETIHTYENVVVLRTFSKIYGLAGVRVGFGVASKQIANQLNVVRGPFNLTSIAQRFAVGALIDDEFIGKTRRLNEVVKQEMEQFFDSIGWGYYESHTNFLLVKTPIDADEVANYLLQNGFIIRSGNLLGYPRTIRITLGTKEDMQQLQEIIKTLQNEINDGVFE